MKSPLKLRVMLVVTLAGLLLFAPPLLAEEESAPAEETTQRTPTGPTPKLYLLPVNGIGTGVSQIVVDRVNENTRRQVATGRGYDLLPTVRELQGPISGDPFVVVAEAERLYTSGIGLVRAGEFQRAAETLQRAVDMIEGHLEGLSNFNILTDALSHLALAYWGADFDLDARQNMQRFAQLRPNARLDPELYPEELREIFNTEAERVRGAETGILTIEADRAGAQVFINGQLKGQTPLVVEDVGFGHHYLLVRQGDRIHREVIRVRARGQEQTITVDLSASADSRERDPLPEFYVGLQEEIRTGRFGIDLAPYFSELQGLTRADFLAWVVLRREGSQYLLTPFVLRFQDNKLVQGEEVAINLDLSNLRARVTRLGAVTGLLLAEMPADLAITSVNLLEVTPPPPVVEAPRPGVEEPEERIREEEEAVAVVDEPRERLPLPSARPESRTDRIDPGYEDGGRDRTMLRYLGYGGAATLAGGLIAGTIILLVRNSAAPGGFDAEVEW